MTPQTESFINHLLSQMSLDEKIGQLNQYFAGGELNPEVIKQGKAGSVINASGALSGQGFSGSGSAEVSNYIQRMALESRLKIPLIFGRDVIHATHRFSVPLPKRRPSIPNWRTGCICGSQRSQCRRHQWTLRR
jgi:beta-glucosidase